MTRLLPQALALLSFAAASLLVVVMSSLFLFLLGQGIPSLDWELFFGDVALWDILAGHPLFDAIWPACVGSLCLVLLTMAVAIPLGIATGTYLACFASQTEKKILLPPLQILGSTPSIVAGLFGFSSILLLRHTLLFSANTGLLTAALCLSLIVLPYLITAVQTALERVPQHVRLTAASLGLLPTQQVVRVFLPWAASAVVEGIILATARAAEDTAVIMLTGAVVHAGLPQSLFSQFEALPFFIFYHATNCVSDLELQKTFGAVVVLISLTCGLHGIAKVVSKRSAL